MTQHRLSELLHEQVADLVVTDQATPAWQRARGVRRRRAAAAMLGVPACVVGAALASTLGTGGSSPTPTPGDATPGDATPTTTTTPTAAAPTATPVAAGLYDGAPVWWAPSADRESALPELRLDWLPPRISLRADEPVADFVADRVEAVLQSGWRGTGRYVVVHDGRLSSVDLSARIELVADSGGNAISPLSPHSLSPDGTRVFFVQPDGLDVWDVRTGTWTSEELPVGVAERARWTPDGDLWLGAGPTGWPDPWAHPGDEPYGPVVVGEGVAAESDFAAGPVPTGPTGSYPNPEIVVAGPVGRPRVLAVGVGDGRSKLCCSLVGWSGDDTVLFESRGLAPRILGWRVGTTRLYAVSELTDVPRDGYAASYAAPGG